MKFGWRMIPNAARAAYHAGAYLFAGRPVLAPRAIAAYRMKICRACEFYEGDQCGKCLCLADLKAAVASESCPVSKWLALTFGQDKATSEG